MILQSPETKTRRGTSFRHTDEKKKALKSSVTTSLESCGRVDPLRGGLRWCGGRRGTKIDHRGRRLLHVLYARCGIIGHDMDPTSRGITAVRGYVYWHCWLEGSYMFSRATPRRLYCEKKKHARFFKYLFALHKILSRARNNPWNVLYTTNSVLLLLYRLRLIKTFRVLSTTINDTFLGGKHCMDLVSHETGAHSS